MNDSAISLISNLLTLNVSKSEKKISAPVARKASFSSYLLTLSACILNLKH